MNLRPIAQHVIDVVATEQAITYVTRDTKADGSVFASFHFVDWESLQTRQVNDGVYLQMKFGELGPYVADELDEPFSCRTARLPDGGCAVLRADSMLCLFRPDGTLASHFFLGYRDAPAYDIVCNGTGIWYTVPSRNVIALFSLRSREMELRVGGSGVFGQPTGIAKAGSELLVSCQGAHEVKTLLLPSYELGRAIPIDGPLEKYVSVFRRNFVWIGDTLYATVEADT